MAEVFTWNAGYDAGICCACWCVQVGNVTKEDFPLPSLGAVLKQVQQEVSMAQWTLHLCNHMQEARHREPVAAACAWRDSCAACRIRSTVAADNHVTAWYSRLLLLLLLLLPAMLKLSWLSVVQTLAHAVAWSQHDQCCKQHSVCQCARQGTELQLCSVVMATAAMGELVLCQTFGARSGCCGVSCIFNHVRCTHL